MLTILPLLATFYLCVSSGTILSTWGLPLATIQMPALAHTQVIFSNSQAVPKCSTWLILVHSNVSDKVNTWTRNSVFSQPLHQLSRTLPLLLFTHGFIHKFLFLCWTMPNIDHLLHTPPRRLNTVRRNFIPALTGKEALDDLIRNLSPLYPRLGGTGMVNPATMAARELI